ncbi:MAG: alpha-amylase family protein, partial [Geminicoccaceae bacterium]
MNTVLKLSTRTPPAAAAADELPAPAIGPRIYYVSPLLAGPLRHWPALLDHVADLGFDHVLIAPPFLPGRTGDLFLPADFHRLHPLLDWERDAETGLRWLAEACGERQMRLLLDWVPDRLAAGSEAARTNGDLFAGPEDIAVLDPRRGHGGSEAARARFDRDALFDWWSTQIGAWTEAGVSGFRVLRLGHLPAGALGRLIASVRCSAPDLLLLGVTPGLTGGEITGLAGSGLDFTFSSLPWWDFQSEWLWTEADALGRIAPPIAMPEAPFEPRLFGRWHDPALQQPAYRRALMFAASTGPGWLMPMGFEYAATQALDPARDAPEDWDALRENAAFDLCPTIAAMNAARMAEPAAASPSPPRLLSGPGADVVAVLRTDAADARFADRAILTIANALIDRRSIVSASGLLVSTDAVFPRFSAVLPPNREDVVPGASI